MKRVDEGWNLHSRNEKGGIVGWSACSSARKENPAFAGGRGANYSSHARKFLLMV